jgi:hypothetical protein
MEPTAKVLYERYVAATGGEYPISPVLMVRWEDLDNAERAIWEAVANPEAPRQPCHGSLLPPATGTLNITLPDDTVKTR